MLRYTKIFLVFAVGIWGLLGTVGNLSNLPGIYTDVREVVSMSGIPEGVGPPWRTTHPIVVSIGVIGIVLGKIAALVAGVGGVAMLKNAQASAKEFEGAKDLAVVGCGLALGLTYLGFTVAAESAFFMFYDERYVGAAEGAFRFSASMGLIAIFVAQREPG